MCKTTVKNTGTWDWSSHKIDRFFPPPWPFAEAFIRSAAHVINIAAMMHSLRSQTDVENIVEMLKMDVGTVQSLIGSLGFPIACVIAMFYMWNKEREDHKSEMQEVTKAIENNTLALTTLVSKLSE